MRIRLSVGQGAPRHDPGVPWWRVTYRQDGENWSEFVEAPTRDEAAAEVSSPGVRVLSVKPVGPGGKALEGA